MDLYLLMDMEDNVIVDSMSNTTYADYVYKV